MRFVRQLPVIVTIAVGAFGLFGTLASAGQSDQRYTPRFAKLADCRENDRCYKEDDCQQSSSGSICSVYQCRVNGGETSWEPDGNCNIGSTYNNCSPIGRCNW